MISTYNNPTADVWAISYLYTKCACITWVKSCVACRTTVAFKFLSVFAVDLFSRFSWVLLHLQNLKLRKLQHTQYIMYIAEAQVHDLQN